MPYFLEYLPDCSNRGTGAGIGICGMKSGMECCTWPPCRARGIRNWKANSKHGCGLTGADRFVQQSFAPDQSGRRPANGRTTTVFPILILLKRDRIHIDRGDYFEDAPNVVVEIHSLDDESYEKFDFYAAFGVPEVWVIDQDKGTPRGFRACWRAV